MFALVDIIHGPRRYLPPPTTSVSLYPSTAVHVAHPCCRPRSKFPDIQIDYVINIDNQIELILSCEQEYIIGAMWYEEHGEQHRTS